jgi:glycosyltransferase involved in cell wall biosynthesis
MAYLTTGYPYVSHTFIQNEVLALRALGVTIDTFAVRREPISECRTPADREAWETTYPLRPPNIMHYLRAHGRAAWRTPRRYAATLARALRMGTGSPGDLVRHAAYFVQAVVLWDRCRASGIAHIHAHFANVASDLALLAATVGGDELQWSFTMHGPTEFYDVHRHRLADKARDARFVVCISDFARSQLMSMVRPEHWDKFHVVHCGVDVERFAPPEQADRSQQIRIACVGRLVPEKGQALLIDAMAGLKAAGLDVHLTLVGDGPERESLHALSRALGVADDVTFTGAVSHPEVEAVLRRSDIFCLPSFAEGVPIVLMEAMAMQLPVVACGVMGIPELIEDGVSGRLIRPGSKADLTDTLATLAQDRDQRLALGRRARERVSAQFDLRTNAARLYRLYTNHAIPAATGT